MVDSGSKIDLTIALKIVSDTNCTSLDVVRGQVEASWSRSQELGPSEEVSIEELTYKYYLNAFNKYVTS